MNIRCNKCVFKCMCCSKSVWETFSWPLYSKFEGAHRIDILVGTPIHTLLPWRLLWASWRLNSPPTWLIIEQPLFPFSWWRHQMETFSALLVICAGNSPVPGEFPAQRPVTRNFDVFFDLRLNNRLSKQSWGWWFETLSRPLWRHCHVLN